MIKILKKLFQSKKINSLINKEEVEKLLNSKKKNYLIANLILFFQF